MSGQNGSKGNEYLVEQGRYSNDMCWTVWDDNFTAWPVSSRKKERKKGRAMNFNLADASTLHLPLVISALLCAPLAWSYTQSSNFHFYYYTTRLPVHIHDLMVSMGRVERHFVAQNSRKPSSLELAERLALPLRKVTFTLNFVDSKASDLA